MTSKLKKKWLHLYEVAQHIAIMQPWETFRECDRFTYIWKDESKTVFFSFLGESSKKCGIACYFDEVDYINARARLTKRNTKQEPVFMLQNALICLWDNRENISKESYNIIKELGFSPRGKGAWLHFDSYKIAYEPVPLSEKEIDLMTTSLENLHMMLVAIYEQGLNPEFNKGKNLVRWYDPNVNLYFTHPFDIKLPTDARIFPLVTVQENGWLRQIRNMKPTNYSVEIDWSFINIIFNDEQGIGMFPRLLLAVDPKNEFILFNEMLAPIHDQPNAIFNMLDILVERYGKPAELIICDEELKCILEDACKKIGIKLTFKKMLPTLNSARNKLLTQIV